jgi:uncharacterized protein YkwD
VAPRALTLFALVLAASVTSAQQTPTEPPWVWSPQAASGIHVPDTTYTDHELELQNKCGVSEAGLRRVAQRLLLRKTLNLPYLDLDGLTFAQRVAGEPHVWPRAWIVSARAMDHDATVKKLEQWRQSFHDVGERRCGIASGYAADGTQIVAAIALDAIGDLVTPIPVRTHVGAWTTVEVKMLAPATSAHVIVVGPSGEPHTITSSFDGTTVRARFAPDHAGMFVVQVVADVATGPRPALETELFADVEPPQQMPNLSAPGESARAGVTDERAALVAMVQAMRTQQSLGPLRRDARLDAIAAAHARRMKDAHTIGHDVGDGDPAERLQNAGLAARESGENVAHAENVLLAHRALWQSPSHRANLQHGEYDTLGVGVLDDPDGSVWVAEVFARGLR